MRALHVLVALMFAAWVLTLSAPQAALAAEPNYSIDELTTELRVDAGGAAHVVERQVLAFDGENKGCVWYLHAPELGESVAVNSVRAAAVDDGGALLGDWVRLQMFDVDPYSQGEDPGDPARLALRTSQTQPWYSYSISDGMMRCWFPADAGSYVIEADYTVANRAILYWDVAELYWRYAHASLPVDASDVTLRVVLPVQDGAAVVPGEDVVAWGHGPAGGDFQVGEDGTVVYHIDRLQSGEYAEAHIVFPASWITDLNPKAPRQYSELHRPTAFAEESEWVDSYARGEHWDFQVRVLFLAVAAVIIAIGIACLARFGRSYRSRRALIRVACTLAVCGLAVQLFFREPFTVFFLVALGAAVLVLALFLPAPGEEVGEPASEGEEDGRE